MISVWLCSIQIELHASIMQRRVAPSQQRFLPTTPPGDPAQSDPIQQNYT